MADINKKLEMCMLVDFYGNLLTDRQKAIFSKFWENDWSLFEIAEELNITRQAVHDSLIKSEEILLDIERKCNFIEKFKQTKQNLSDLLQKLDKDNTKECELYESLMNIISQL